MQDELIRLVEHRKLHIHLKKGFPSVPKNMQNTAGYACASLMPHLPGVPGLPINQQQPKVILFHHYTDKKSAQKIWETGIIKASTDISNDAVCGPGVYGSPFGPEYGKKYNALNNYSPRLWEKKEDQGKLDCVITIEMSNENIAEINTDDGRSILLYKNADLTLRGNCILSVKFVNGPQDSTVYYEKPR